MALKSGMDLLVLLLHAPDASGRPDAEIRGITRLEKLVFLTLEEGGLKNQAQDYRYQAYELGPYSKEVIDYIEALKGAGLVEVRQEVFESHKESLDAVAAMGSIDAAGEPGSVEIYSLSPAGVTVAKTIAKDLSPRERDAIETIKKRFNRVTLPELLRYVYKKYPKMTTKSKILDEVLGVGSRRGLK